MKNETLLLLGVALLAYYHFSKQNIPPSPSPGDQDFVGPVGPNSGFVGLPFEVPTTDFEP